MSPVGNYHIQAPAGMVSPDATPLAADIGPKSALKDERRLIQEPAVALAWR
ncbi:MAG: hypothetical protein ACJ8AH_26825 [Stellaceae bacterium]|jgi:hypothetical protein